MVDNDQNTDGNTLKRNEAEKQEMDADDKRKEAEELMQMQMMILITTNCIMSRNFAHMVIFESIMQDIRSATKSKVVHIDVKTSSQSSETIGLYQRLKVVLATR